MQAYVSHPPTNCLQLRHAIEAMTMETAKHAQALGVDPYLYLSVKDDETEFTYTFKNC